MDFFAGIEDLTTSFNEAITSSAHTLAMGVSAAAIFALADDEKNKKDDMAPLKAVAKLSLMGMVL